MDEILVSQVEQTERRLLYHPLAHYVEGDDNPHIQRVSRLIHPKFSDLMILDSLDGHKRMPVRQFVTTVNANGQRYLVRVQQLYDEFNELARDLSILIIIGFLGLMTLSVLVGLGLSSRLWCPFYTTINQLSQFRLDQPTSPAFSQAMYGSLIY